MSSKAPTPKNTKDNSISVVIPAHNRPSYLVRAIDSVASQTILPTEVIVVDDCSEKPLADSIPVYKNLHVIVVRLENKSNAAYARNAGALHATGNILAFLDSDDEWFPNHLKSRIAALERGGKAVFGGFYTTIGDNVQCTRIKKKPELGSGLNYILADGVGTRTSTFVVDRIMFHKVQFDSNLEKHQDWDFFIRFHNAYGFHLDESITVTLHGSALGRMSSRPNHNASKYFWSKHGAEASLLSYNKFYCSLMLMTFETEGKNRIFWEYYSHINWFAHCVPKIMIKKLVCRTTNGPNTLLRIRNIMWNRQRKMRK